MTHADGHESEQTLVDMAISFTDEKQICILPSNPYQHTINIDQPRPVVNPDSKYHLHRIY